MQLRFQRLTGDANGRGMVLMELDNRNRSISRSEERYLESERPFYIQYQENKASFLRVSYNF